MNDSSLPPSLHSGAPFADQLSIGTPEQVALQFPVAGIGSRFVALLLDHLIQFAALFAIALAASVLLAATGHQGALSTLGKWTLAAITFVLFLLFWGYFALFEAFWHGQTPGKRAMHLRVLKDAGRQITLFESLARNLLRVLDYLPSVYVAGVITMLANKSNKRLGDLAAGTIVVHERAIDQPLLWSQPSAAPFATSAFPTLAASAPAVPTLFPPDAIAQLTAPDLVLIETFFARALDLPLETRAAMAYRIVAELCTKMHVPPPEGNPERALEAMALALRAQRRPF